MGILYTLEYMSKLLRIAECHPDIKHYANGLCRSCYNKAWRLTKPDYRRDNYLKNREKQLEQGRKHYRKNKDKVLQACREYRLKHPEKQRNRELIRRYGITLQDYELLLKIQQFKCKLCLMHPIKNPVVDHNHITGSVRGIVCQGCNILIGCYESKPDAFNNVVTYVSKELDERS